MEQKFSPESVSILHELDLGQHTLFIYDDNSIDLLANDEHTIISRGVGVFGWPGSPGASRVHTDNV